MAKVGVRVDGDALSQVTDKLHLSMTSKYLAHVMDLAVVSCATSLDNQRSVVLCCCLTSQEPCAN